MTVKKGGLGRGLSAILMDNDIEDCNSTVMLKISEIEPNREQPRTNFNDESLAQLAESIAQHGVLQPLIVRPILGGGYQIIAGERRWRACRMSGITEVPVIIREMTDSKVLEIALIENLQREDLTPIEEALGYKSLMENYNFTQDEIAKSVGKSRSAVANAMRLLSLPDDVIELIKEDKISPGHGRTLLSLQNQEDIIKFAKMTADKNLSVRELEKIVKITNENNSQTKQKVVEKRVSFYDEVELALNQHLCRKVKVKGGIKDKGTLEIEFYNKEDLADLARLLGREYDIF